MFEKILRDGHVHSHYCPHGTKDSFDLYIENAIKAGLKEITFTEHMSLPKNFIDPSPLKDSAMREEDIENYIDEINENKKKYKDIIKINLGFEVDYLEGCENETIDILDKYGKYIDDSILSLHMLNIEDEYCLLDFDTELYGNLIKKLGSLEEVYLKYYNTINNMVKVDLGKYKPKRVGHFNLIRKFQKVFPYDYTKHRELLEKIMILIKEKKMELDYNVSGLRKEACGEVYVEGLILKLAKQYGVDLVFGSDAHSAEYVGITPLIPLQL